MPKDIMHKTASDNQYLHRDFHGALSIGLDYLENNFGEDAVREYLRRFTVTYYAPLKAEIMNRGLLALREHFEKIYATECGRIEIEISDNELILRVEACPAVMHMRKHGYSVSKLFYETNKTVNEALTEGTPFTAELLEYDEDTGRSVQRFFRSTI